MRNISAREMHALVGSDLVTKYKGVYKAHTGYFYRMGNTETKLSEMIDERLTKAGIPHTMIDCGDNWTPFRGGDPVQKSSHFWATFTVDD